MRTSRLHGFQYVQPIDGRMPTVLELSAMFGVSQKAIYKEIEKYKKTYMVCPRCGTRRYVVKEEQTEIVLVEGKRKVRHTGKYDYYCAAPTPDDGTFSKCWYHFDIDEIVRKIILNAAETQLSIF